MALSPKERQLVGWFRYFRKMGRLPSEPFWLRPGTKVCAPELLYDELEAGCAEPPRHPHARGRWLERLAQLRRAVERPLTCARTRFGAEGAHRRNKRALESPPAGYRPGVVQAT